MRKNPLFWHAQIFQITILYASPCLMHQCPSSSTVRSTMTKKPFVTKSLHFPLPPLISGDSLRTLRCDQTWFAGKSPIKTFTLFGGVLRQQCLITRSLPRKTVNPSDCWFYPHFIPNLSISSKSSVLPLLNRDSDSEL